MNTRITLKDQLSELKREARLRRSLYPRFVQTGKLSIEEANRQEERLAAAIQTLERLLKDEEPPYLDL